MFLVLQPGCKHRKAKEYPSSEFFRLNRTSRLNELTRIRELSPPTLKSKSSNSSLSTWHLISTLNFILDSICFRTSSNKGICSLFGNSSVCIISRFVSEILYLSP